MKLIFIEPDIATGWSPMRLSVHAAEILGQDDRGSLRPVICLTEASKGGFGVDSNEFRKMLPPPLGAPPPPKRFELRRGGFFEGVVEGSDEELQVLRGGGYKLTDLRAVALADFLSAKFAPCSHCGSRNYWKDEHDGGWHCATCEHRLPPPGAVGRLRGPL